MAAGETNLEISGGAGNTLPPSGRILVAGASRGIGRHIAVGPGSPSTHPDSRGADVGCAGGRRQRVRGPGREGVHNCVSAGESDRLTHMLDIVKADGGADMAVNCAGIFGEVAVGDGSGPVVADAARQRARPVPHPARAGQGCWSAAAGESSISHRALPSRM